MKRFFSLNLYKDGLAESKAIGLVNCFLVGFFLLVQIFLLFSFPDSSYRVETVGSVKEDVYYLPVSLVALFLAPLSVFLQFRFVNSRSASDRCFALPYTKLQLFGSYFAVTVTHMLASYLVAGLVGSLLACIINKSHLATAFYVISEYLLPILLNFTLSAFLLMSIMLLSVCLCGTDRGALLLFLALSVLPRLMLYILGSTASLLLPHAALLSNASFFSPDFFLPYSCAVISDFRQYHALRSAPIIYALCLSVGLILLAAGAFVKRKSETAGKEVPSKKTSLLLPTFCAFPFLLIAVIWLFEEGIFSNSDDLSFTLILLCTALAVYLICGTVVEKRLPKFKKSAMGLALVFALSLFSYGGIKLYEYSIFSFTPESDEISSIRLVDSTYGRYTYDELFLLDKTLSKNERANEIVSSAIRSTHGLVQSGGYENDSAVTLDIRCGLITQRLSVVLNGSQKSDLISCFLSEKGDADRLPAQHEVKRLSVGANAYDSVPLDKETGVYGVFSEEFQSLSYTQKQGVKAGIADYAAVIVVSGEREGVGFTSTYYVPHYMVKTVDCINRYLDI